jgi:hypothetical protein
MEVAFDSIVPARVHLLFSLFLVARLPANCGRNRRQAGRPIRVDLHIPNVPFAIRLPTEQVRGQLVRRPTRLPLDAYRGRASAVCALQVQVLPAPAGTRAGSAEANLFPEALAKSYDGPIFVEEGHASRGLGAQR